MILGSEAFFNRERIGGKIKSPIQLLIGTCRLLGTDLPDQRRMTTDLEKMGQIPFAPPNVKGWPAQFDSRRWINTATLLVRYNTAQSLVNAAKIDVPDGVGAGEIVDYWLARLIGRPVDAVKRRRLASVIGSRPRERTIKDAIKLIVAMPEYQLC